jgi:hypothetical protein
MDLKETEEDVKWINLAQDGMNAALTFLCNKRWRIFNSSVNV